MQKSPLPVDDISACFPKLFQMFSDKKRNWIYTYAIISQLSRKIAQNILDIWVISGDILQDWAG